MRDIQKRTSDLDKSFAFVEKMARFEIDRIERLHTSAVSKIRFTVLGFTAVLAVLGWIGYRDLRSFVGARVQVQVKEEIARSLQPDEVRRQIREILREKTEAQLSELTAKTVAEQVGPVVERTVRSRLDIALGADVQRELAKQLPPAIANAVSDRLANKSDKPLATKVVNELINNGITFTPTLSDDPHSCRDLSPNSQALEAATAQSLIRWVDIKISGKSKQSGENAKIAQALACSGKVPGIDIYMRTPENSLVEDLPPGIRLWLGTEQQRTQIQPILNALNNFQSNRRLSVEPPSPSSLNKSTQAILITLGQ